MTVADSRNPATQLEGLVDGRYDERLYREFYRLAAAAITSAANVLIEAHDWVGPPVAADRLEPAEIVAGARIRSAAAAMSVIAGRMLIYVRILDGQLHSDVAPPTIAVSGVTSFNRFLGPDWFLRGVKSAANECNSAIMALASVKAPAELQSELAGLERVAQMMLALISKAN